MYKIREKKISIIGLGKVGYALLNRLLESKYNIYSAIEISKNIFLKVKKEQRKLFLKSEITSEVINNSDVIIISVKDDEIESICEKIKSLNINVNGKIIFHTSGVLSSKIISKYFKNSKYSGSFQPIQTFNKHSRELKNKFNNIYILIEGGTNYLEYAKQICRDIKCMPIIVNENQKRLFHITSVFASNYLIAYLEFICDNYLKKNYKSKMIFKIVKPLIISTIDNIDKSKEFYDALSGPIERGDINTINKHLEELKNLNTELYSFYKFLGMRTINLALKKKSIDNKTALKIKKLFKYD